MTALEWMLLEQLVHAEAWARTATVSPIDSLMGALALALICALTLAIVHAGSAVVRLLSVLGSSERGPRVETGQRRPRAAITTRKPSGAQGARAPATVPVG